MANLGRAETTDADRQLVKALAHPVRAKALTILNERVASPIEISGELGVPVGTVSYHVSELERIGWVKLVKTEQRRGAVEHFYRGVARNYLDDRFWAELSDAARDNTSLTVFRVLISAARESLAAGLFDERKDRHASVVTYDLDEQGWAEAHDLYEQTLNRLMDIGLESEVRLAESPAGGSKVDVRATFGLLAFESPSSPAKK
ncbi:MAG TPA: winged helix-turn-helix domain-containing protein [Solirubrobacterales bacterium]|nr:winged helix-turn-helix domain-containing protein [Solirubrobacterales bacterium]